MKRTGPGTYVLSTGRELRAGGGVLGLLQRPGEQVERLTGGFDGVKGEDDPAAPGQSGLLTDAERREIALLMCRRWARWGGLQMAAEAAPPAAEREPGYVAPSPRAG